MAKMAFNFFSTSLILGCFFGSAWCYAPLREPHYFGRMDASDATFMRDLVDRINKDMEPQVPQDFGYFDLGAASNGKFLDHVTDFSSELLPGRAIKDSEFFADDGNIDYLLHGNGPSGNTINLHSGFPSIRDQEYLHHSTLNRPQSEAQQASSLKVKGQKVPTEVRPDTVLPAYCNPPNPCPIGMSGEEGCIEDFQNTAAFSRAYQGSQDCMCDTEHMFDCHAPREQDEGDDGLMMEEQKRIVAKKGGFHTNGLAFENLNPYLQGEKLPVAAKKGKYEKKEEIDDDDF